MVEAKGKFLEYDVVCRTYKKPMIDQLIQSNLLHLRPTKCFSHDLTYRMDGVSVVTLCGYVAMKQLLNDNSNMLQ